VKLRLENEVRPLEALTVRYGAAIAANRRVKEMAEAGHQDQNALSLCTPNVLQRFRPRLADLLLCRHSAP